MIPAALLALLALVTCTATSGERVFWREGPVTIEAQLNTARPQPIGRIVYIDAAGFAYRDGIPVDELDRAQLLDLVTELLEYEMALSWPPEPPATRRKR
jgi:hypothetical protein